VDTALDWDSPSHLTLTVMATGVSSCCQHHTSCDDRLRTHSKMSRRSLSLFTSLCFPVPFTYSLITVTFSYSLVSVSHASLPACPFSHDPAFPIAPMLFSCSFTFPTLPSGASSRAECVNGLIAAVKSCELCKLDKSFFPTFKGGWTGETRRQNFCAPGDGQPSEDTSVQHTL
jgi:hypothetical protein